MLIAHLSDPHLRPRGQLYKGLVDSNAMFDLAVHHLNRLDPAPDLVLITGDLVDEGFDLAVRIGRLADSSLVTRRLAPARRVICASPEYLKQHGTPISPADLTQHQPDIPASPLLA